MVPSSARNAVLSTSTLAAGTVSRAENSALELTLRALRPLLDDPKLTELCINRPGEAFVETRSGWRRESLPFADFDWCRRLAKLVANSTRQRIEEESPLLSASLPTGERIQIVMPPATSTGTVAITIRRPSDRVWSIGELGGSGIFDRARRATQALDETEPNCCACWRPSSMRRSCVWRSAAARTSWCPGPPARARRPTPRR